MKQISKRSTFAVLFYINKSKQKKNGLCPVMGRITIDTEVAQFSTKTETDPGIWDAKVCRATGKTKEALSLNRKLDKLEEQINKHYNRMVLEDAFVTAESVKNALNGVGTKATYLLQLFMEHNEEFKLRVGVNRVYGTYYQYLLAYKHLAGFIQQYHQMDDIPLCQLNQRFIDNFDFYLRVDKRMTAYTVLNHIIPLRKMIRRAINQDTLKRDPFVNYVPEQPVKQRRHLTAEEFQKLLTTSIESKTLCRTRDMFVFSAFTGLSYADMKQLSDKHLVRESDGTLWISIERQKTKTECNIRLLNIAVQIIDKYKSERKDDKIFNMITLSNTERNLKKIASLCDIDSNLTYHMSRHTYATQVCISQGVPIETLSKMMGHRSITTTQIYAKITNQKVNEDMKILSNRIENKYELPKDDIPKDFHRNQYFYDKEVDKIVYVDKSRNKDS